MPGDLPTATLDEIVARWGQSVRFSVASAALDVSVGMARAHVIDSTSDAVLSAMMLAHKVLTNE